MSSRPFLGGCRRKTVLSVCLAYLSADLARWLSVLCIPPFHFVARWNIGTDVHASEAMRGRVGVECDGATVLRDCVEVNVTIVCLVVCRFICLWEQGSLTFCEGIIREAFLNLRGLF